MPIPQNYKKQGRVSAKSLVLNQLQDWIIEGVLKPDEKINDGELAEALGVSRTPVREALQILEPFWISGNGTWAKNKNCSY